MRSLSKLLLIALGCVPLFSYAQDTDPQPQEIKNNTTEGCSGICTCASSQTPAGVMTDHIHGKGQWMASYTYMNTLMQGNQAGANKASDNTVYESYAMAPEKMTMQMHMAMLMYGVTDRLTLMAMGGYSSMNMRMNMSNAMMSMPGMVMPMGDMTMKSTSSCLTDTKVSALYNFSATEKQRIIGSLGISLPTGTIKATGTTMLGDNQRLPYDMQTGSGSYSVLPDITYVRNAGLFSYGANAGADIKLNNNSLGYKLGNVYHGTAWASYKFLPFVSGSLRAEYVDVDKISGSDAAMDISYYQTADPTTKTANYGGNWVNIYVGLNFHVMKPVLDRFTLLTEYGMPVYQNLNGIQTALHNNLYAGLQYAF